MNMLRRHWPWLVTFIILLAIPFLFFDWSKGRHSGFVLTLMSEIGLMAIFALSFNMQMGQAGLLMPLDHAKIPNIKNIDPAFADPDYDKGRKFSMPYTWLVLGLGYRKSKMQGIPDSWKWVFDSPQYKGRIALRDARTGRVEQIERLNVRLGAETAKGPFNAVGEAIARGRPAAD